VAADPSDARRDPRVCCALVVFAVSLRGLRPEKERPPMPESQLPYCPVLVLTIRAAASILTKPPGAPSENSRPLRLTSQAMYRNPGRSVDGADRRALHLQPRTGRNFAPGSLHFLIGYDGSRYAGHAIGIKLETGPATA
jgi:hypothetical protein